LQQLSKNEPQLEYLDLSPYADIVDAEILKEVGKFLKLKTLNLSGCNKILNADLAYLGNLSKLEVLDLSNCGEINLVGLIYLRTSQSLRALSLAGCSKIKEEIRKEFDSREELIAAKILVENRFLSNFEALIQDPFDNI
jgi:Leucine-rich repeat (LRR) protein